MQHHSLYKYWPRYIARCLRYGMEYRGELIPWKFSAPRFAFAREDAKVNEVMQTRHHPIWKMSIDSPWDKANLCGNFPYLDQLYTVEYPDGSKLCERLNPLTIEEQTIFKGDRVKLLVGPDKGKIGIVASVLRMRRLLMVDNLNCQYIKNRSGGSLQLVKREVPLHIETEVTLIDPSDDAPCEVEWRVLESSGELIRVSTRTGREIPLPALAYQLDDLTTPSAYEAGEKDTKEKQLLEVTFEPKLTSFEDDVLKSMNITETKTRAKTFWY